MKINNEKPTVNNFYKYLNNISSLKNFNYWRTKKAWHAHPDCPKPKDDKTGYKSGYLSHPDFQDGHLIGVSGSNQGIIVGEKLISEYKKCKKLSMSLIGS